MARVRDLVALLEDAQSLAIVCHDNPDPDCLASSLALRTIASVYGLTAVDMVHRGTVSDRHGQALVNSSDVDLVDLDGFDFGDVDLVAFVDHNGGSPRTDFPATIPVDVVIDHHPAPTPIDAAYVDVREEVGATSTILTEYLRELDVDVSSTLASTLLFALHHERIDYMHRPTVHEYRAALHLFPMADLEFIDGIYSAPFSPATMDTIGRAIRNREVRGASLASDVGFIGERGALSQAVDLLLLLEGIGTAVVFGVVEDVLYLSARSVDPRVNTAEVLTRAFGNVGDVGGDRNRATGEVPLGLFAGEADDDLFVALLSTVVSDRFFGTLELD
jgi:nanoRNase/pAp phosphatase (c-di-AMP/oligoRNAs hydrolase)